MTASPDHPAHASPTATSTPSATSTRSSPPRSAPAPATTGCRTSAPRGWRRRRRSPARPWPSWTACWPRTRRWPTTRSSAAAPGCCASGSAPSSPRTRPARGCRALSNLFSPVHSVRQVFSLMPAVDRGGLGRHRPPDGARAEAYRGFRETPRGGRPAGAARRPAPGAARSSRQLDEWLAGPYFAAFRGDRPRGAAVGAGRGRARPRTRRVAEIRDFLRDEYAPAGRGDAGRRRPRAVRDGRPPLDRLRPRRGQRAGGGLRLGLGRAPADPGRAADRGGQGPARGDARWRPCAGWRTNGPAVEGVEAIREWLQEMMDDAIAALDGTHFDLAEPVRRVEAMIAPPGSAAAPYYTRPAQDFSRPGRTWLPTLGPHPVPALGPGVDLVPRGRPGPSPAAGAVGLRLRSSCRPTRPRWARSGANVEGWALYAERLMDELGYFTDPGERLGFLDAQQLRSVRVVIDIGMHLGLPVPDDAEGVAGRAPRAAVDPGAGAGVPRRELRRRPRRSWTASWSATSASRGRRSATSSASGPGWTGARPRGRRRGADFDLKAWHMAALSQGSLGLDDLAAELAQL